MEITQLEQMTKEEVLNFIRKRLSFGPEIKMVHSFQHCYLK